MAETPAEVRREIEMTRERMSGTIEELERKLNVKQMVVDNPWPALALAVGAGVLLSGTKADMKAAAATLAATRGASSKLGEALDDVVENLMTAATDALRGRVDGWVVELKQSLASSAGGNGLATTASPALDIPRAD